MFIRTAVLLLGMFGNTEEAVEPAIARLRLAWNAAQPVGGESRIVWDRRTLRQVSDSWVSYSGYARMIELKSGVLLCVYEADGSILSTRSFDKGNTWEKPIAVAWRQRGINMAAPDVLELEDGSVMAVYNPRPYHISKSRNFGIRTRKSYDGGKTWKHGRLVHEAGHKFIDGCWEPSAIQLPNGEIQLYFADEGAYRKTGEQNISMYRSTDGGLSWTTRPQITCFWPKNRDGMPSPLVLQNGREIVVAIEDLGWIQYFKPSIVRTRTENPWPEPVGAASPNRTRALTELIGMEIYAGAPYLRQLSTGETLLSYQGTEERRNSMHNSEMKVTIGDERALAFNRKTVPFDIPRRKFAMWNSLCVLEDDTIIAVTSTNAFSQRSEVWMIKGRAIPAAIEDTADLTPYYLKW